MRIVATMVVRDEVDIVAANLDHHLHQGVAHILVTDNGSIDGTREVLDWYERNRAVTVFDEPAGEFRQGEWVTHIARLAVTDFRAEWMLHVDADEFLVHEHSRLDEAFGDVDPHLDVALLPRHDYVALDDAVGDVAPALLTIRKRESLNLFGTPLIPKVAHRAVPDAVVTDGNHEVTGTGLVRFGDDHRFAIHHYPARSLTQDERKVTNLANGYRAAGLYEQGIGTVSVERFEMIAEGTFEDDYRHSFARSHAETEAGLRDGSLVDDGSVRDALLEARTIEQVGTVPAWVRGRLVAETPAIEQIRRTRSGPVVLAGGIEAALMDADDPQLVSTELQVVPFGRDTETDAAIANARPSRTGIDGVMRPRDADHRALLDRR